MSSLTNKPENKSTASESKENQPKLPSISLPKGGGAIRGIGEKFASNPVTGTGSFSIPIYTTPGRSGFGPQLSLSYDSGSGNGPYGIGWSLSLPSITRKTDKGLPRYQDFEKSEESDEFILSGAEDLVPVTKYDTPSDGNFNIKRYRPRIEGLFARIERWTDKNTGEVHWRSISKDNITTLYGKMEESRISDPSNKKRVFSWLICESYDDKGNAIFYRYEAENSHNITSQINEKNRNDLTRSANRYLKRIFYGNCVPHQPGEELSQRKDWLFEVVFDYEDGHYEIMPLDAEKRQYVRAFEDKKGNWPVRQDPFSNYRSGFEIRTYRLCHRVLMFHHFPEELKVEDYLVRSTEFTYNNPQDKGPVFSFITKITQSGYVLESDDTNSSNMFLKKSLPPIEFEYSQANVDYKVQNLAPESLENLPYGLDGTHYQWVDLDGEGLSGILTEQTGTWFYKRNTSPISVLKDKLENPVRNEYGDIRVKAEFGSIEIIKSIPSLADLNSGRQQFLDLAGDGKLDLAEFNSSTPGFYERTENQQWEQFTAFTSLPKIDWNNPNLKFVDLTGDGHADIIITENEVFSWYESLAESGFSPGKREFQAIDEEKGPRLVFSDGSQSIYLADISGDGLTDLVRVRNGEVCYWPNLGYGRFGAKVTMDNSPWFDNPDQFNQQRIRLADIDGSGTTDIIYLKRDGVHIYFNQSGNGWTELEPRIPFPQIDNLTAVMTADLLGNGTACLVWSSPLPGNAGQQMRYIDLMGGQKPHLLVGTKNNLGAETRVHYAPSTKFYLEDQKEGKPWITRIPFPVHVVERVETYDKISGNRFVTRYAYHHGYFDGVEREFRGFGMVEQWDTEEIGTIPEEHDSSAINLDLASFVPPIHTKTWFHTGAYQEAGKISQHLAQEYYGAPKETDVDFKQKWRDFEVRLLPDTILPPELTPDEEREACRSLKGAMLRQEIYADDAPMGAPQKIVERANTPYSVTEQNFTIEEVQVRASNRHAVFFTHPREALSYHYERNPKDPRINHALTLDVDDFGNVLRSITVNYPRAPVPERQPEQNETHIILTLNWFANRDDNLEWRRIGMPVETRTYEVVKPPTAATRFTWDELLNLSKALVPLGDHELPVDDNTIPYEQWDWRKQWDPQAEPGGLFEDKPFKTRLRLIEHVRTLYRPNDLGASKNDTNTLLPLGTVESLALPGETYKLSFTSKLELVSGIELTPGLVDKVYGGRVTNSMLETEGHYVHSEGDKNWWIPSGKVFYSHKDDIPDYELIFARKHFFLPHRFCDPFGNNTIVYYDNNYDDNGTSPSNDYNLLLKETRDALENRITAENNYRVLQPKLITDPNGNRSAAAFDALGMVVGTAVMGKEKEPDGKQKGDTLEGFVTDLTLSEIRAFVANPRDTASALLNGATSRIIYDVNRFSRCSQPIFAATLAREIHQNDPGGDKSPIQISLTYSDGFGREIQTKIQAEKGDAPERGPDIELLTDDLPNGDIKPGELVLENGNPKQKHTDHRWVGKGRTVYNNKGKPVKQYEPFFSSTHLFEEEKEMTDTGVTPVIFYDPVERVIATLHPNHTYEKVVFDPWHQKTYDVNDTVTGDPRTDPDISSYVAEYFKQEAPDPNKWKTWLQQRGVDPSNPPQNTPGLDPEVKAAIFTLPHADTPTVAYFDTMGRTFLTIANNGKGEGGKEKLYKTHTVLDIEGNQRQVIDAKDRIVMIYDYDMLSNKIHQSSMEAGERWILNNVANNPIRTWDSRGFERVITYDSLQRPLELNVTDSAGKKFLAEKTEYGESKQDRKPEETNHRLKPWRVYDGAGILVNDNYDFKGNLLQSSRHLLSLSDCKGQVDWNLTPKPDEIFISSTVYDALNRPIQIIAPHIDKPEKIFNITQPVYNEANLLEGVNVWLEQEVLPDKLLDPNTATYQAVKNIDYNAKGQRDLIEYGNGAETRYTYDKETFRLTHLYTRRGSTFTEDCDNSTPPPPLTSSPEKPPDGKTCGLQNLHYTYDPVGNIIFIRDDAQQTIFFKGQVVRPDNEYTYDAIYRLVEAHGREHKGQTEVPHTSWNDTGRVNLEHPHDGTKMTNYFEYYEYDEVGNIQSIDHKGDAVNWIREYQYNETSQIEANKENNRLTLTTVSGLTERYKYDIHGNMIFMPHFKQNVSEPMAWDFEDQLQSVDKGNGCSVYYTYDAGGQRVRKIIENNGKNLRERIYIGGYEVYREYNGSSNGPVLERESLHIMDNKQRIALVETRTIDTKNTDKGPRQLIRYQYSNHLGSASLELNDQAQVISYEEYYPYGNTSYQAINNEIKAAAKRYHYTGKERDEETGFNYHGARYYAPWLGRWTSCDPEISRHLPDNPYIYAKDNPLRYIDTNGRRSGYWERAWKEFKRENAGQIEALKWQASQLKHEILTWSLAIAGGVLGGVAGILLGGIVGLIVGSHAGFVAGAAYGLKDWEWGRETIRQTILHWGEQIPIWGRIQKALGKITWGGIKTAVGMAWGRIKTTAGALWGGMKRAWGGLRSAAGWIAEKVKSLFRDPDKATTKSSGTSSRQGVSSSAIIEDLKKKTVGRGHFFGPLIPGVNPLGGGLDVTGSVSDDNIHTRTKPPSSSEKGVVPVFDPGLGFGYSYTKGESQLTLGFAPRSSLVPYYPGNVSQPFAGQSTGPYFGFRLRFRW